MFVGVIAWAFFVKWQSTPAEQASSHVEHAHHGAVATAPIITTTFDDNGVLYAAEAKDNRVTVSVSRDFGRSFNDTVRVTPEPEIIDANGEARPKIVVGHNGEVLVSWTRRGTAPFTGDIRFSRSLDGGRTFSTPVVVNDDGLPIGHRFDTLGVAPDGTIVLTWIDKRDLEAAQAGGRSYDGAAVYIAASRDGGATFSVNRKVQDHSCECCRIGLAFEADSTPVLLWRHVLPGSIRDHVIVRLADEGQPAPATRVSHEGWAIEACPHHGPTLAISASGRYHFAWFTAAESTGNAVFYAHSDDRGRTTSAPLRIGDSAFVGHPSLAVTGSRLWLAWKEWDDDDRTATFVMYSDDDGRTWGAPKRVATAFINSDRPFLVTYGDDVYLSWTDPDGLRVIPVGTAAGHLPRSAVGVTRLEGVGECCDGR